jgi:Ca2+-binding EF-hand superfamily protein
LFVCASACQKAFKELGFGNIDQNKLEALLLEADIDGNGEIDEEEFARCAHIVKWRRDDAKHLAKSIV